MPRRSSKTPAQKRAERRKAMAYKGNPNLKKAHVELEYTQEQIDEYQKCAKDIIYFCQNYMKIITLDDGEEFFDPFEYQQKIMHSSIENRFTICKLPRQSGKTTAIVGVLLWFILFTPDFSIAVLANKAQSARRILKRLQFAYEKLPFWLQQGVVEWNKGTCELENRSRIVADSTSGDTARGDSFNLVYLDEFAFVEKNMQDDFFASVYPTISSGTTTRVLITSTPKGLDLFYRMWTDAINKNNDYNPIEIHWSDTPGRDEKWKRDQIRNTSERQFQVEFECEFVGSQNTLISPVKLRNIPYLRPKYFHGDHTKIYEEATPGHIYTIVVDTSQGVGEDFSAFIVFDVTEVPYKVVAIYRNNKIAPILYPQVVFQAAKNYNSAYVLIETNDIGLQVAQIMHEEFEYENVLYSEWKGRAGQVLDLGFGSSERQYGVRTTNPVKRTGCATIKTIIESDRLEIRDFDIVAELSTFVANKRGTSFEADEGCTDDLVMCLVLFAWMTGQTLFKELTDIDIRKNLIDANRDAMMDESVPFMFQDHGSGFDIFAGEEPNEFANADDSLVIAHPFETAYDDEGSWDHF